MQTARVACPAQRTRRPRPASRRPPVILASPSFAALQGFTADACVIGSGSVGVATALALAAKGFRVLVLESGGTGRSPPPRISRVAENLRPDNHFEPHTAVGRRLGGSSNLWAGRCVPFDPIDFRARPWLGLPAWPVTRAELAPYLAPALDALGAGAPVFVAPLGVTADPAFRSDTLERWSNIPRSRSATPRRWPTGRISWWRCRPRCSASATPPTAGSRRWSCTSKRAGGSCPSRASSSPPAATPAPGCCCSSRRASPGASAAPTARSGASTWGI